MVDPNVILALLSDIEHGKLTVSPETPQTIGRMVYRVSNGWRLVLDVFYDIGGTRITFCVEEVITPANVCVTMQPSPDARIDDYGNYDPQEDPYFEVREYDPFPEVTTRIYGLRP